MLNFNFNLFRILKTVYLGADDSETNETGGQESKNLEVLLLEKNKSLQVEQGSLRSCKRELESMLQKFSALTIICDLFFS